MIGSLLEKLSLDVSFFYQLIIFVATFYLLKQLFILKLQNILILRYSNTIGKEIENSKLKEEVSILNEQVKRIINDAKKKHSSEYLDHKREKYHTYQQEIGNYEEMTKEKYDLDLISIEENFIKEINKIEIKVDDLGNQFIKKFEN